MSIFIDIVAGCLGSRHLMAVLLFFGFFVSYALRINISVAIVAMVNQSKCRVPLVQKPPARNITRVSGGAA